MIATEEVRSAQIDQLAAALAKAQGQFPEITKTRTAKVRMKSGGEYSYDYADLGDILAAVRPVLSAVGLSIVHSQRTEAGVVHTRAMLIHESGQWLAGQSIALPLAESMAPTQAIGSAMTYGRRYTTQSILGLATETDDDGNGASGNQAETTRKPAAPKAPDQPAPKPPHLCQELRDVLSKVGCTTPAEADAVTRLCLAHSLEECKAFNPKHGQHAAETIREMIAERAKTLGTEADACRSIYAEALEKAVTK